MHNLNFPYKQVPKRSNSNYKSNGFTNQVITEELPRQTNLKDFKVQFKVNKEFKENELHPKFSQFRKLRSSFWLPPKLRESFQIN